MTDHEGMRIANRFTVCKALGQIKCFLAENRLVQIVESVLFFVFLGFLARNQFVFRLVLLLGQRLADLSLSLRFHRSISALLPFVHHLQIMIGALSRLLSLQTHSLLFQRFVVLELGHHMVPLDPVDCIE